MGDEMARFGKSDVIEEEAGEETGSVLETGDGGFFPSRLGG